MSDFALRPAVPSDLPFIFSTWLRELRAADRSPLPDDLWFPAHREAVTRVLAARSTVVTVAHPPDDPNEILGYAVGTPGEVLHWVHVLRVFRGRRLPLTPQLLQSVGAPPGTPAAWQHPAGRALRNSPRPRWARRFYSTTTTSDSSARSRSESPADSR